MDDFLIWARLACVALGALAWFIFIPPAKIVRNPFLLDGLVLRLLLIWIFAEIAVPEIQVSGVTSDVRSWVYILWGPMIPIWAVLYRSKSR